LIVTILGSGSGKSDLDHHHAALLVAHEKATLLLDCGEGTSRQLLRNAIAPDTLDAIAISHLHPDHVTGLFMVLQNLYLNGRKKPLNIFLPERVEDVIAALNLFYLFPQRLSYEIRFSEMEEFSGQYPFVQCFPTSHMSGYQGFATAHGLTNECLSWGFVVRETRQLLYSGDVQSINEIKKYLPETDLLIIDAFHTSAEEILLLKDLVKGRVILNHGLSYALGRMFENRLETGYEIAHENKTYRL